MAAKSPEGRRWSRLRLLHEPQRLNLFPLRDAKLLLLLLRWETLKAADAGATRVDDVAAVAVAAAADGHHRLVGLGYLARRDPGTGEEEGDGGGSRKVARVEVVKKWKRRRRRNTITGLVNEKV